MPEPIQVGTEYDGSKVAKVVDHDPNDDFQPYLYELEDGRLVWIPDSSLEEC